MIARRRYARWMGLILVLVALGLLGASLWAAPPPATPSHVTTRPPRPPEGLPAKGALVPTAPPALQRAGLDELPPLKAVLLVGPIDGDYGTWTTSEKANMDLAAEELSATASRYTSSMPPTTTGNRSRRPPTAPISSSTGGTASMTATSRRAGWAAFRSRIALSPQMPFATICIWRPTLW